MAMNHSPMAPKSGIIASVFILVCVDPFSKSLAVGYSLPESDGIFLYGSMQALAPGDGNYFEVSHHLRDISLHPCSFLAGTFAH